MVEGITTNVRKGYLNEVYDWNNHNTVITSAPSVNFATYTSAASLNLTN